jgi:ethanolamine permease
VLDGFKTIFGAESALLGVPVAKVCGLFATAGLIASFHGIMFAYGRQIYSLSRAGYFPRFLSLTHSKFKTPYAALIAGGVIGYAVMLALYFLSADATTYIGTKLLCMAVFGAMISYVMQMLSYIILRVKFASIPRPYKSPFGIPGAAVAGGIAAITLVTLFVVDPANYQSAAIGAACWFIVGLIYFTFYSRHHLVLSPEEEFARKVLADATTGAPAAVEFDVVTTGPAA